MMAGFHFELVSPDKLLFNGQAEDVLVPGSEGDFLVLRDHAPVMASLRPGIVDIGEAGKHTRLFVRGGFADVSKAGLIVLAETAIPVDELSAERIGVEIKDAEENLADATDDQKRLAQEKLDRLKELKDALKL
jgi:F-type H+-transporting ATPase subunit epsilon